MIFLAIVPLSLAAIGAFAVATIRRTTREWDSIL